MAAPVVKLSEVRARFPMYADLSDEQLLIGVRKQFYPDIPMAKFAGMVGVAPSHISQIETGVKKPSLALAARNGRCEEEGHRPASVGGPTA